MLTMTKVENMKREAKAMRKSAGTPLHQALDLVAQKAGFHHWKHVTEARKSVPVPADGTLSRRITGNGTGQALPAIRRSCSDCAHLAMPGGRWCAAPQLADHLDASKGHQNEITPCEGVRDIKTACGHAAVWFVPRSGQVPGGAAQ